MRYAVIMAGGAGKRLWPLSRLARPKQLLPLVDGQNLLSMSVSRLKGVFDDDKVLILTNAEYAGAVAEALPQVPRENIIGEPEGRDTANAVALGAALLEARDPDATMAIFTADHVIRPVDRFADAVNRACITAETNDDALVTFGVRPTWPHTGLGYVECAESIGDEVHRVAAFKEKPNHQNARQYVDSGKHYWNSGMFVWKVAAIQKAISEFLPDSARKLQPVTELARNGKDYSAALAKAYPLLQKISIDYAVMEKSRKVFMVELNCEWLDIGSWPAMETVTPLDESGNAVVADNAVLLDSYRNVVVTEGDHLLAILGMDDCIVVHSDDATLICNKSDSQRIKELVELIGKKYGKTYI